MQHLCTTCIRSSMRAQRSLHGTPDAIAFRTFTTSTSIRADDKSQPRSINAPPAANQSPRASTNASGRPGRSTNATPPPGQLLRRVSSPIGSQSSPGGRPQQGTLLHRTAPSTQQGQVLRRTGPPRVGGRPGGAAKGAGPPGKQRRRRTAESVKAREAEDEEAPEADVDDYMTKYIDRPANPTERIEYNPKPQKMFELQKDWPNTPMSTTGLSASLIQKIEWAARRLPHGYQTPEQLAEHFQKGYLTRFESEQEKEQVLKIAAELAKARASQLSERKGSEVAAEDMSMAELSNRDEKKTLIGEVVKGEAKELERQKMPFLDSIMRNLRNNETYHKPDVDNFMATINRLMPASAQRRPQQQRNKA